MKFILFLLVTASTLFSKVSAQVIPIYFYGDSIVSNKNKATSYAVYGKLSDQELWAFKRYDLYDNLLQTGSYKDDRLTTPHGVFSFYMDLEAFNDLHLTNYKLKDKYRFLSQAGNFTNGLEDGKWQLFYPDGTVFNSQVYVKGKLQGEFVTYDKYGNIEIKGNYVDGQRDGLWIFEGGAQEVIYEKGVLKSAMNVKKGKKSSNTAGLKAINRDGQNQRNSAKLMSAPNPTRAVEELIEVAAFNRLNGTRYKASKGAKFKMMEGNLVDGLEDGTWSWFYPDGTLRAAVDFSKGKANGNFVWHAPDGKIRARGNYVDGKRDGEWLLSGRKEIYKNGIPRYSTQEFPIMRAEDVMAVLEY